MPSEHQRALPWPGEAPSRQAGQVLERVTGAARRRAARSGDREVDTGHLLHSLLESDGEALRAAAAERQRAARLMGYLAQRSIGFGLGWQRSSEAVPVPAHGRPPAEPRPAGAELPPAEAEPVLAEAGGLRWSRAAADALERARLRAVRSGSVEVTGLELLAELVADPGCRAAQILARAGIEPAAAAARCAAAARRTEAAPQRTAG